MKYSSTGSSKHEIETAKEGVQETCLLRAVLMAHALHLKRLGSEYTDFSAGAFSSPLPLYPPPLPSMLKPGAFIFELGRYVTLSVCRHVE